jgi:hypothetical protein
MLNEVVCRFGCPFAIHSDQGRNFESGIFQELFKILEIRKTRTRDLTNLFPAYLMALTQAYFLVVLYWTCVEVYSPHIFHTD